MPNLVFTVIWNASKFKKILNKKIPFSYYCTITFITHICPFNNFQE